MLVSPLCPYAIFSYCTHCSAFSSVHCILVIHITPGLLDGRASLHAGIRFSEFLCNNEQQISWVRVLLIFVAVLLYIQHKQSIEQLPCTYLDF